MTTAVAAPQKVAARRSGEFPHVFGGVVLTARPRSGASARPRSSWPRRDGIRRPDAVVAGGTSIVRPEGVPGRGMPGTVHNDLPGHVPSMLHRLTRWA